MLSFLLGKLQDQDTENLFTYSVVVVDNDGYQTAKDTVKKWQDKSAIQIDYYCEPEQNIALARNRGAKNATGDHIAFIDDDELPVKDWLYRMYRCLKEYNADSVLGPVLPHFPAGAPEWLEKSGLCERHRNKTGSPITGKDMRTGNILFQQYVFDEYDYFRCEKILQKHEDFVKQ